MKRWLSLVLLALAMAALPNAVAQDDDVVRRNRGGTINFAPYPAVYRVVGVDDYNRVVALSAASGSTAQVHVPEWAFDLCRLQAGDLIRVDFAAANAGEPASQAATIWPVSLSGQDRCKRSPPSTLSIR